MEINREDLEIKLDRINGWINNCDQKTSILMAIEGVVLTIFCTSDYISLIHKRIIIPIYTYYKTGNGVFSLTNTIQICLLLAMFVFAFLSIFYSLQVIKGETDISVFKQPGIEEKSLIHFSSISNNSFNEFKRKVSSQSEKSLLNDLFSQIYINSSICYNKFKCHKKSVFYFCMFMFSLFTVSFIQFITK